VVSTDDEAVALDDRARERILTELYRARTPETYWGRLYWVAFNSITVQPRKLRPPEVGRWFWRLIKQLVQEDRIMGDEKCYRLTAKQWLLMTGSRQRCSSTSTHSRTTALVGEASAR
jgi:hypothetical protein